MATVNEKMTAIANAIRAKTGGTEPLGLDAMAQVIAALETGGGLPEGISALAYGTYTSITGYRYFYLDHNLGVVPNFTLVYVADTGSISNSSGKYPVVAYLKYDNNNEHEGENTHQAVELYKNSSNNYAASTAGTVGNAYATETQCYITTSATSRVFPIGVKYFWVCGCFSELVKEETT